MTSEITSLMDKSGDRARGAAVRELLRAELDNLGGRLQSFRDAAAAELERLGTLQWLTETAGLSATEVAERAGVSRQTLINLRSQSHTEDHDWPIDVRVLLDLGLGGAQSVDGLIGSIARGPVRSFEVEEAIRRLTEEQLIEIAGHAAAGATASVTYWRLTTRAIDDLPRRLRHAGMPPSRAWTAYVTSSPGEANAIAAAGVRALGQHAAAVIPAGTVTGMERPEVAFRVEASDPNSAASAAVALFRDLRARAGMAERQDPVIVAALVAPSPSDRRAA